MWFTSGRASGRKKRSPILDGIVMRGGGTTLSENTGDVNAHSTLWYSHNDDHRGQLISDIISNSEHITLNTDTPTRVPHPTLQQITSPDITTISTTLYNRTKLRPPSHNHNNQHTHQIQTTTKQTHIHKL